MQVGVKKRFLKPQSGDKAYNDPAFVLRGDLALKQPPKPVPSARNACYKAGLGL